MCEVGAGQFWTQLVMDEIEKEVQHQRRTGFDGGGWLGERELL